MIDARNEIVEVDAALTRRLAFVMVSINSDPKKSKIKKEEDLWKLPSEINAPPIVDLWAIYHKEQAERDLKDKK